MIVVYALTCVRGPNCIDFFLRISAFLCGFVGGVLGGYKGRWQLGRGYKLFRRVG